jgi:hypothetical protein
MKSGGLYLVNTIVTGNKAASGGAIYNNGKDNTYQRKLCLVNSTVAGNSGSYEIEFPKAANLNMVNSIVAGGHTTDLYTRTVSQFTDGGHNIVGTVSSVFTLEESTTSGKTVNDRAPCTAASISAAARRLSFINRDRYLIASR